MDFCDHCRRHLNGALTCAGCGRSAEALRQEASAVSASTTVEPPEHSVTDAPEHGAYAFDAQGDGSDAPEPGGADSGGAEPGDADPEDADPDGPGGGRAETRRSRSGPRRARSKRGRRVLIGALGLVLAAGLLSLAQLALDPSGKEPGVGTSVDDTGTSLDTDSDPGASAKPGRSGPGIATPAADVSRSTGAPSDSATPSASADASTSATAGNGTSTAPSGHPSTGGVLSSGNPGGTSSPGRTDPADPPATTPAPPVSQQPPPSPSPTETCHRVIVWCT